LGILNLSVDKEGLSMLADLTLALVLFTDSSNANLKVLKRNFHIPQRLLLIGLPLTILLRFGVGVLLYGAINKEHKHKLLLAAEGTGDALALITWVIFGALVIGRSFEALSWEVVLYAVLSHRCAHVAGISESFRDEFGEW
jgi:hypothetical protein